MLRSNLQPKVADANGILTASAVTLARAIRERRLTSRAVIEAHIARIRKVNPTLNALVRDRFAEALREADLADEKVRSVHADDLPPFHGIPFTTKDAIAAKGMPLTAGLWSRRDVTADTDATAVRRLKEAGAILLGVSNVSELCMWMESANHVWGRTNNAHDPTRIAGGSSGGEGALVGSGASVLGLGSDVGGSIRMPAFFNGAFGHKPTGGLVPSTGHFPAAEYLHQRYVTTGPLARRAEDLMPFLRIVAGPDGIEEHCKESPLGRVESVDFSKLTVWVIPDNGLLGVDDTMALAQDRAARALEAAGARIERRRVPALKRSAEIWSAMLHEGGPALGAATFNDQLADGGELRLAAELAKFSVGRSRFTFPSLGLAVLEKLATLFPEQTKRDAALGPELRRELESMIGDDGIILFPSYPTVAPRHHVPLLLPLKWIYTGVFNVLEMPVTQVPMGLDERGLPTGVQVAAKNGADAMTIAAALQLERAVGGWTPPRRWPL